MHATNQTNIATVTTCDHTTKLYIPNYSFNIPFHQAFKHIHALIVSADKEHRFLATRSAPPENALSAGTLVAGIAR